MASWFDRFAALGVLPGDHDEDRLRKATLTLAAAGTILPGFLWTLVYVALGFWRPAVFPLTFAIAVSASLLIFVLTRRLTLFRITFLLAILLIPVGLQLSLGGFEASGGVILWSLLSPVAALMVSGPRPAAAWFGAYLAVLFAAAFVDPFLGALAREVALPTRRLFFVMNLGWASAVVFGLMVYFASRIREEQARSEKLLLNILPQPIADRLKRDNRSIADGFAEVTVLFADIVDFTRLSQRLTPHELVALLNRLFSEFDALAEKHGLEKIKTIGDAYMVVG
ncbi:MAG: hypothetical protein NTZ05_16470, partial [Chloroflexi bacterium]|nr:hypothetical protein [Chloroflexota bacterium]